MPWRWLPLTSLFFVKIEWHNALKKKKTEHLRRLLGSLCLFLMNIHHIQTIFTFLILHLWRILSLQWIFHPHLQSGGKQTGERIQKVSSPSIFLALNWTFFLHTCSKLKKKCIYRYRYSLTSLLESTARCVWDLKNNLLLDVHTGMALNNTE